MVRKLTTHCIDCGEELTIFNSIYTGIKRRSRCGKCYSKYQYRPEVREKSKEASRRWKLKNLDKIKNQVLETKYKISLEEYNKLLKLQLNGCAICKLSCSTGDKLSVDHNHETGKIRGLLCKSCNLALGNLKEDEDLIWNLLDYLKNDGIQFRDERSFEVIHVKE